MTDLDPVAYNRNAWNQQVEQGNEWTRPVGPGIISRARQGDWSVVLIGHEPVARDWFPASLWGVNVLCLASGGGQQGPVLAAVGANVTVFDNSDAQLAQDRMVAEREGLPILTVQGDMRDLSALPNESFDLVFHPVSNVFCPEIEPVWQECWRVLKPGGSLLAGFMNPDIYLFDRTAEEERGELVVRHRLPYADRSHLTEEEFSELVRTEQPFEYSHTMDEQIGGQLRAGFVITHFTEAPHHAGATAKYMSGYFATRAVKVGGPANQGT